MTASFTDHSTRDRILREGARLFAARGYHGVSMREVAEAVGVTKPALYHHYADKEALFLAIMEGALADLRGAVADALSREDFTAQVRTLALDLIVGAARYRPAMGLAAELKHIAPDKRADFEARYRAAFFGAVEGWMQEAARADLLSVPPGLAARTLMGLISPYVTAPAVPEAEHLADQLTHLFLHGALKHDAP